MSTAPAMTPFGLRRGSLEAAVERLEAQLGAAAPEMALALEGEGKLRPQRKQGKNKSNFQKSLGIHLGGS